MCKGLYSEMAALLGSIISSKRQFISSYLSEKGEFSQTVITCFILIVEAEPWGMVICKDTSDSSCQMKWSFFIDSLRLKQAIRRKPGENLKQSLTCGALHFKERRFLCRLHRMRPLISHWRNIFKLNTNWLECHALNFWGSLSYWLSRCVAWLHKAEQNSNGMIKWQKKSDLNDLFRCSHLAADRRGDPCETARV